MSYRVELAVTGRAGCNNKECKDNNVKIAKNELRLGTWVVIQERGSWHWRHWGCVTGKQLEHLRHYLEGEDNIDSGVYRWDFLDGYDDGGKGSLNDHPDLQEKVRRVIEQGFIDPEDWKGDPEMNRLGEKGTRTVDSKKRIKEERSAEMGDETELQAKWDEAQQEFDALQAEGKENTNKAKLLQKKIKEFSTEMKNRRAKEEKARKDRETGVTAKSPAKKRGRGKKDDDEEEEEEEKPAKKKRATKAKKEESDEEEEIMPAKKVRGKGAAVKDEEEEDVKPAKKSRAKKSAIKDEEDDETKFEEEEDEDVKPASNRPSRVKKSTAKKELKDEDDDEVLTKQPAKKGRKKSIKEESPAVPDLVSDSEDDLAMDIEEEETPKAKPTRKASAGGKAKKSGKGRK